MIEIKNVNFRYQGNTNTILDNITVDIQKGEFIGIIGPTGSGKSTFCYLLNGLIPHSIHGQFSGSVKVNDLDTRNNKVDELSTIVGYMLQEPSFQIATPFVESEIAFGMENFGFESIEMEIRINEVLRILGIENLRKRATSDLSEGEKQRVILASILAIKPEILVLDECTSMLDASSKKELATTLKSIHLEQGKTIIMIEHDLDYLLELVDRIILINNGKIIADGLTTEVLTDSNLLLENNLQPPNLIKLFTDLQKQGLNLEELPTSYQQASKILGEFL
ncbi:MAG: energy-coupling factor ABC transporter ATP-binding protein [Candidatus Thorarchaeota archaeon]